MVLPESSLERGASLAPGEALLFIAARGLEFFDLRGPVSHLSVVAVDTSGVPVEYEGVPEHAGAVAGGLNSMRGFGRIVVQRRRYRPDPLRRHLEVPLNRGEPLMGAFQVLEDALARLNRRGITYNVFGPNSNSVVRTLLHELGLDPLQPAAVAPGFEYPYL